MLLSLCLSAQSGIFQLSFKVKTTNNGDGFPALLDNKNWNSRTALEIDLLSNSNYGKTLTSGNRKGWSFFIQKNGAWAWNIGDGKKRLDYLPTAKQRINDGEWHELEMVFVWEQEIVRLYFDKKEVAIYNFGALDLDPQWIEKNIKPSLNSQVKVKALKSSYKWAPSFNIKDSQDTLNILNWNIWHGGRHNGIEEGIAQTIQIIQEKQADVIFLQETYGSGPIIADSLGMNFFLISSNLSILSKFPFVELYSPWDDFRFGGAVLQTGPDQYIAVFDTWLNYLPDTDKQMKEGFGYWEIQEQEIRVRGREALDMMKSFKNLGLICPVLIAGDFNSGSHLDWTLENAGVFGGYFLPWPASKTLAREGFTDSFRARYPEVRKNLGFTWSPRFKDGLQYRIDYIYHDPYWQTLEAGVEGYEQKDWPSDHAMTWAKVVLQKPIKP